jgi:hypothetical protein
MCIELNMRAICVFLCVICTIGPISASAQDADADHDGLSDRSEQALLDQFAPNFMIARHDCSNVPAEFFPDTLTPLVLEENGTIYGQAFPSKLSTSERPAVELHFYHLWRSDCGPRGHHLDTEHVAVLVRASESDAANSGDNTKWHAEFWYAAAHENTVCDVSQIARASTLHAEDHGAKVWISPGKHASYLNETLCDHGCGADKCIDMVALKIRKVVNLGEVNHPMSGSNFIASAQWPLIAKMSNTDFPPQPIARLEALPDSDIAWFNSGRHPVQQVIAVSSTTEQSLAASSHHTTSALFTASDNTDVAISLAGSSTGNALGKSYNNTKHALGSSAKYVGKALHFTMKPDDHGAPQ